MRLRSLTKHVKDQNWFAVALDFFIVVVGILIAFQITNWNEAQQDNRAAKKYHARLVEDMELSIDRNQLSVRDGKQEIQELNLILEALEECRLDEADKADFAQGLKNMGKYDLPVMVMGTIDELNSTGNFPLIGGAQVRRTISETLRNHQVMLSIDPQVVARLSPSLNYVRTRVRFPVEDFDPETFRPRSAPDDLNNVIYDFEDLCADDMFVNAVSTVREMTAQTTFMSNSMAKLQEALLIELQGDD